MSGLLIKDIKLMKNQTNFFVVLVLLGIAFSSMEGGVNFIVGFLTFVCSLFTISTISYDEFDNGNAFLFTLPFERADYVKEKYVFGLLVGSVACVAGTVISGVIWVVKNNGIHTQQLLSYGLTFIVFMIIDMILLSLLLPFQLKFGSERSRIALMITFGAVFLAVVLLGRMFQRLHLDFSAILNGLTAMGMTGTFVLCFLAGLVCLVLSCTVSCRIVNHKEF